MKNNLFPSPAQQANDSVRFDLNVTKQEQRKLNASEARLRIVYDQQEQTPWQYDGAIRKHLKTGDYSLFKYEHEMGTERKNPDDLIGSHIQGRDRFERELIRFKSYRYRAIIAEAPFPYYVDGNYRSSAKPDSLVGTFCSWARRYGINYYFTPNAAAGRRLNFRILEFYHENRDKIDLRQMDLNGPEISIKKISIEAFRDALERSHFLGEWDFADGNPIDPVAKFNCLVIAGNIIDSVRDIPHCFGCLLQLEMIHGVKLFFADTEELADYAYEKIFYKYIHDKLRDK